MTWLPGPPARMCSLHCTNRPGSTRSWPPFAPASTRRKSRKEPMSSNQPNAYNPAGDLHLVIKATDAAAQLNELASELLVRREAILDAGRAAGDAGPGGSIASS